MDMAPAMSCQPCWCRHAGEWWILGATQAGPGYGGSGVGAGVGTGAGLAAVDTTKSTSAWPPRPDQEFHWLGMLPRGPQSRAKPTPEGSSKSQLVQRFAASPASASPSDEYSSKSTLKALPGASVQLDLMHPKRSKPAPTGVRRL